MNKSEEKGATKASKAKIAKKSKTTISIDVDPVF